MMRLKTILLLLFAALICAPNAKGEDHPLAEIVDYGIYSGQQSNVIADANSPSGTILKIQGKARLTEQTAKIPARLGTQFGFRFVIHGSKKDRAIKLHLVWLYPEITNAATGVKSTHFEGDTWGIPGDKNSGIMWTFTETSELVPGDWTFQVFKDGEKILEKKFEVQKADEK